MLVLNTRLSATWPQNSPALRYSQTGAPRRYFFRGRLKRQSRPRAYLALSNHYQFLASALVCTLRHCRFDVLLRFFQFRAQLHVRERVLCVGIYGTILTGDAQSAAMTRHQVYVTEREKANCPMSTALFD